MKDEVSAKKINNKMFFLGSFKRHCEQIIISILFYFIAYFLRNTEFLLLFMPFIYFLIFTKIMYFIVSGFQKISNTVYDDVSKSHFLLSIFWSIALIIISFAVDYTFLFYMINGSFSGIESSDNIIMIFLNFIFLSASIFFNTGFSDIIPKYLTSKMFALAEMAFSFVFIIGIISNFMIFREIFEKNKKDN